MKAGKGRKAAALALALLFGTLTLEAALCCELEYVYPPQTDYSFGAEALRALLDSKLIPERHTGPQRLKHPGILAELREDGIASLEGPWGRLLGALGLRFAILQAFCEGDSLRFLGIAEFSRDAPGHPFKNSPLPALPMELTGAYLAATLKPEKLLTWALEVARRFGPWEAQLLEDLLAIAKWNALLDVEQDILRALDGSISVFVWEGAPGPGFTIRAGLRDPARLSAALGRLELVSKMWPKGFGVRASGQAGRAWRVELMGWPTFGVGLAYGELIIASPLEATAMGAQTGRSFDGCLELTCDVAATLRLAGVASEVEGIVALGGTIEMFARLSETRLDVWGTWTPTGPNRERKDRAR